MPALLNIIVWTLYILTAAISVLCLVVSVRAAADVVKREPTMFVYMGKRSKRFWLIGCLIAAAFSLLFSWQILSSLVLYGAPTLAQVSFLQIIAAVFSGVYLADVKPAVS